MNWKNINSYNYTKDHTVKDWGWEFIRRDVDYIAEWNEIQKNWSPNSAKLDLCLTHDASAYSQHKYSPWEVNVENPAKVNTFVIPSVNAEKWGLKFYQNPAAKKLAPYNLVTIRWENRGITKELEPQDYNDIFQIEVEDTSLVVVFDLSKPLKKQLDEAGELSRAYQKGFKKHYPDIIRTKGEKVTPMNKKLWISYLRHLDAVADGAPRIAAAKIIFGDVTKWDDAQKSLKNHKLNKYNQLMA